MHDSVHSAVFRVDSGALAGSGHVMRCRTLADELVRRGWHVAFVCRELQGHMISHVDSAGHSVVRLGAPPALAVPAAQANWLGVDSEQDAQETRAVLETMQTEWLIVDHYGIDAQWEQAQRSAVGSILVIDDLANRSHDCDLLLDQNYFGSETSTRYVNLVPAQCRQLLGPRYALIRPEYADLHAVSDARGSDACRILVFFGASDATDETSRVLQALSMPDLAHLVVDVVIGVNHPAPQTVEAAVARRKSTLLHRALPSLAGLMLRADLAIGAGGTSTWERLCLRLPSVVVTIAENQRAFTAALAREGYVRWLGDAPHVTADQYAQAIRESLMRASQLGALVDGQGVFRVGECLVGSDAKNWRVLGNHGAGNSGGNLIVKSDRVCVGSATIKRRGRTGIVDFALEPALDSRHARRQAIGRLQRFQAATAGKSNSWSFLALAGRKAQPRPVSIAVLAERSSWIDACVDDLCEALLEAGHHVALAHDMRAVPEADLCFLLSWGRIVPAEFRRRFIHTLVAHASDLPRGRGWSPLAWEILAGNDRIVVSLIEAEDQVDTGRIYAQESLQFEGHELLGELQGALGEVIRTICVSFVATFAAGAVTSREQAGEPSYYRRRIAADSALDPASPLLAQFNLLRTTDNRRYPAYFDHLGHRYYVRVAKAIDDGSQGS